MFVTDTTKKAKIPINNQQHPFHLVKASPWPICVAFSLFQSLVYLVL